MKFENVIEAIRNGSPVRRQSWGQNKKFIFRQVPSIIPADIVQKMQSLPEPVKKNFAKTFLDEKQQIKEIYYDNQIALVGMSMLISAYAFSAADILAEDWEIVDDGYIKIFGNSNNLTITLPDSDPEIEFEINLEKMRSDIDKSLASLVLHGEHVVRRLFSISTLTLPDGRDCQILVEITTDINDFIEPW